VAEPDPPDPAFPADAPIDDVFGVVYERLKALASRQLARGARGTLDTTALVHELYLRVNNGRDLAFAHPAQFFAYAARAMRHLLADRARDRMRQKAGGEWVKVTLTGNDSLHPAIESAEQALALEEALTRLEQSDARAASVVELRWFTGLDPEQVAAVLQVTRRTVDRDWRYARAFLHATLGE
jgi:RNA polymerase sigma factor (TIGR02999 family)